MARIAFSLIALALSACGTPPVSFDGGHEDADPPVDGGPVSLQVGIGEGIFHPIEDGQAVEMVTGCQGSQHVWTAIRATGVQRRGTIIELSLVRDRDQAVVSQAFRVRISLQPVDGQSYTQLAGLTLLVPEPEEALEESLTLTAQVEAEDGTVVTDSRPVRVVWGEGGCG